MELIAGISIDFNQLPTQVLENLLANDLWLGDDSVLTLDDIFQICEILSARRKSAEDNQ